MWSARGRTSRRATATVSAVIERVAKARALQFRGAGSAEEHQRRAGSQRHNSSATTAEQGQAAEPARGDGPEPARGDGPGRAAAAVGADVECGRWPATLLTAVLLAGRCVQAQGLVSGLQLLLVAGWHRSRGHGSRCCCWWWLCRACGKGACGRAAPMMLLGAHRPSPPTLPNLAHCLV